MRSLALYSKFLAMFLSSLLVACGGSSNNSTSADQVDDSKTPAPKTYNFTNSTYTAEPADSVSYTGQVARQLLIMGMVDEMNAMTESGKTEEQYLLDLDFFMNGDGANDTATGFTLKNGLNDGSDILNADTYGAISSGKNLDGKIAGGNGEGGGETSKLINDEFIGWSDGLSNGALPIDLVDLWIAQLASQASDGTSFSVPTVDGDVPVNSVQYDEQGRNQRQLLQKFLMGAVSFSQGTNDYFQSNWAVQVTTQEGSKNYTEAEHNYDEAFGYYGAARDNNDYTDLEARAKSGRDDWKNGYYDTNGDGFIDPRSEFNFGHAQNCAKRDVGRVVGIEDDENDLSKAAMDAFLAGRHIIANASAAGSITDAELEELQGHIKTAALTWEKCIAATAIHYINDVSDDIAEFSNGSYASVSNFTNLGKHWSELKGFALSLQFSPFSPFRDPAVTAVDLYDLETVLSNIGDKPVLANDTQGNIDAYKLDLIEARTILQNAYSFDPVNVAEW